MPKKAIDLEIAKQQLDRINSKLDSPHLLIGGLAVQRYVATRNSKDIDLVCEHSIAQNLARTLYPTNEWKIQEPNDNSYRPVYKITHRSKDMGEIILGPKISEREPYRFIDWEYLLEHGQKYIYQNKELDNIVIPSCAHLAFTKLISFLLRDKSLTEKRQQDLQDFVDLTNNDEFIAIEFVSIVSRSAAKDYINSNLDFEPAELEIIKRSAIYGLVDMLNIPRASVPAAPAKSAKSRTPQQKHDMPLIEKEVMKIAVKHGDRKPSRQSARDLIIVVDPQRDFFEGGALVAQDSLSLIEPLNRLLVQAQATGAAIVFTRDWHPEDHRSFTDWGRHCVKGTPGAEFHPNLSYKPDQVLVIDIGIDNFVDEYSPFDDLRLPSFIVAENIRTIYVVGIALEFCVLATCRDAMWFGKTVVAVEPLIRAANPDPTSQENVWDIITSMGVVRAKNTALFG